MMLFPFGPSFTFTHIRHLEFRLHARLVPRYYYGNISARWGYLSMKMPIQLLLGGLRTGPRQYDFRTGSWKLAYFVESIGVMISYLELKTCAPLLSPNAD